MNTSCPICGKAVDPLRARNVKVRDGKVVAFCSPECAQAAETKPTAIPKRTPATGVPKATPSLDSGPVIEIVHEPASGVVTSARDTRSDGIKDKQFAEELLGRPMPRPDTANPAPRPDTGKPVPRLETAEPSRDDTTLKRWAVELGDDIPGEGDEPDPVKMPSPITSRSKAPLIVFLLLVVLGAGAFLAWRFVLKNPDVSASTHAQPPPPPPPVEKPGPVEPVRPDPSTSVNQALDVLRKNVESGTPRVQRVAAAALARTKDSNAIEVLADSLAKEKTDVAKLDLAYALARAGDERGITALNAGLGSARRDVKIQAGRLLALLGDARATPALAAYLEVSQLRLGAAEQLAYLREPRAIKALETIRADAKTSPDDRARATIALGIAGRNDVTPDLQALLKDARFNAFAASALSQLGDPTARAVLAEQLAIPSLRVEAARSLRRLDPSLDPAPLLPELVGALASNKDTEQVQIAEAILLLAGDVAWSERP